MQRQTLSAAALLLVSSTQALKKTTLAQVSASECIETHDYIQPIEKFIEDIIPYAEPAIPTDTPVILVDTSAIEPTVYISTDGDGSQTIFVDTAGNADAVIQVIDDNKGTQVITIDNIEVAPIDIGETSSSTVVITEDSTFVIDNSGSKPSVEEVITVPQEVVPAKVEDTVTFEPVEGWQPTYNNNGDVTEICTTGSCSEPVEVVSVPQNEADILIQVPVGQDVIIVEQQDPIAPEPTIYVVSTDISDPEQPITVVIDNAGQDLEVAVVPSTKIEEITVTDTETKTEISTVVVSGEETSVVQVDNGASVDTYIIDNTTGSDQPISVVVPEQHVYVDVRPSEVKEDDIISSFTPVVDNSGDVVAIQDQSGDVIDVEPYVVPAQEPELYVPDTDGKDVTTTTEIVVIDTPSTNDQPSAWIVETDDHQQQVIVSSPTAEPEITIIENKGEITAIVVDNVVVNPVPAGKIEDQPSIFVSQACGEDTQQVVVIPDTTTNDVVPLVVDVHTGDTVVPDEPVVINPVEVVQQFTLDVEPNGDVKVCDASDSCQIAEPYVAPVPEQGDDITNHTQITIIEAATDNAEPVSLVTQDENGNQQVIIVVPAADVADVQVISQGEDSVPQVIINDIPTQTVDIGKAEDGASIVTIAPADETEEQRIVLVIDNTVFEVDTKAHEIVETETHYDIKTEDVFSAVTVTTDSNGDVEIINQTPEVQIIDVTPQPGPEPQPIDIVTIVEIFEEPCADELEAAEQKLVEQEATLKFLNEQLDELEN